MARWIGLALAVAACASGAPADEEGHVAQAILGGTPSDSSQDDVVMLVQIDPVANVRVGICTATLIAPRLVLTARHCVADVNDGPLACADDGTAVLGGQIAGDRSPDRLFVFTGKDRPQYIGYQPPDLDTTKWTPAGQAAEVIDDHATNLCNHDLALILLKEPITNVPLAALRLDSEPKAGEKLLTVGWGVASDEVEPKQREQRGDVMVTRVGPDAQIPVLTKSEFLFDESICLGDSGGPIFSQSTKAIVGVVSRGGNGDDPGPNAAPAATCVDADNVGSKLSAFRDVILGAFQKAGATPILEPKPSDDRGGCAVARPAEAPSGHGGLVGLVGLVAALALGFVRRRRDATARP